MLPSDPLSFFCILPKRALVQDERVKATSTVPATPVASPLPAPFTRTFGSLTVSCDRVLPPRDAASPTAAEHRENLQQALDRFFALKATERLLTEISGFPDTGLIFPRRDPEQTVAIDASNARSLRPEWFIRVHTIHLVFTSEPTDQDRRASPPYQPPKDLTALLQTRRLANDELGRCEPLGVAAEYWLFVRLFLYGEELGAKYWPCPEKPDTSVSYRHWRPSSAMAQTLAHEALHVWYEHAFSYFTYPGTPSSGHGVYTKGTGKRKLTEPARVCDADWWTPVEWSRVARPAGTPLWPGGPRVENSGFIEPFRYRLNEFIAELDATEPPPL